MQRISGLGGSERHLLTLLPALGEAGIDVSLLLFASGEVPEARSAFADSGIDITWERAGADIGVGMLRAIRSEFAHRRPDLLHTHLVHADLHGRMVARMAGVPIVSSAHSVHSFFGREPVRSTYRATRRWISANIAISDHVARFLIDHRLATPDSISVVPYGIEAHRWHAPERGATLRASVGVADGSLVVGVASRLIAGKGHALLLAALAEIPPTDPPKVLLVAGDGPLRSSLEHQAERLGLDVRFLGFVADMPAFMNASDIVVFPTQPELGEGFGLAALEAMAAGRPVIASAIASLPEVVLDRTTGLLVASGSSKELAKAVEFLASDPSVRQGYGRAASIRAANEFSLEPMAQSTIGIYREVLTSSR